MTLTVSILSVSGMINVIITASGVSEKLFALIDEVVTIVNSRFVIQELRERWATFRGVQGGNRVQGRVFQLPDEEGRGCVEQLEPED